MTTPNTPPVTPDTPASDEPDPKLLEILVCPVTKGPLTYDRAANELVSVKANLAFPIRNGVPLMTVEAARSLDDPPKKASQPSDTAS